ncbi:flagellar basal body-associated FliL family protein [Citrobacter sp. Awk 4]|uniref:flagellar basal body-associated FliL family protein n=1 Tax=Citrobacter sp. Awk 4 TaxID=2963955 RepID=UPI002304A858|nr:flagellar basal body-associated FliL family protein [Citrobacter sp. Awk 4]MDA8481287.1 flagellar basal body-associated FliL family protein [Citrobacter sp. Awk 4]
MVKNIIIGLLLLLLAGGGGYFYLGGLEGIQKKWGETSDSSQSEDQPELQIYTIEKVLLTLPETGETRLHHAQLDVVLTSFDPKTVATLKKLDPLLRNIIVETFSDKTFNQLREMKNFNTLQKDLQSAFVVALARYKINLELVDVKLSKMVLQ